ncbi:uncharacterized protein BCR38DRAFT_1991 [Pseudomassariella vexata]|uniref:Uncharacterized protein n=1 Tax=Pseudomassariella vexata TaxID=1141098 RepID=A0A1Y2EHD6_9PEZI|nr:uncharacterized protein BCR38DRAFT_1991 [Pseudomassariella vexata]ORY70981.1 hypothetical protein BCR38DRAFT_1991 [Pseudomassariella vexata]
MGPISHDRLSVHRSDAAVAAIRGHCSAFLAIITIVVATNEYHMTDRAMIGMSGRITNPTTWNIFLMLQPLTISPWCLIVPSTAYGLFSPRLPARRPAFRVTQPLWKGGLARIWLCPAPLQRVHTLAGLASSSPMILIIEFGGVRQKTNFFQGCVPGVLRTQPNAHAARKQLLGRFDKLPHICNRPPQISRALFSYLWVGKSKCSTSARYLFPVTRTTKKGFSHRHHGWVRSFASSTRSPAISILSYTHCRAAVAVLHRVMGSLCTLLLPSRAYGEYSLFEASFFSPWSYPILTWPSRLIDTINLSLPANPVCLSFDASRRQTSSGENRADPTQHINSTCPSLIYISSGGLE